MKLLLLALAILATLPIRAVEPEPFAATPFTLEVPRDAFTPPASLSRWTAGLGLPKRPEPRPLRAFGVSVYFQIGPVRIDYGVPIPAWDNAPRRGHHFLDAPGRGYRELRTQAIGRCPGPTARAESRRGLQPRRAEAAGRAKGEQGS